MQDLTSPMLYHAHHSRHLEDLPFWFSMADKTGACVLELGCGTGRVTLPLAEAGYHLCAIDNHIGMLNFLQQNLYKQLRSRILLICGDLRNYRIDRAFGSILIPCNTLSTISPTDLPTTLFCAYQHLREEGMFAASMPNPELLSSLPANSQLEIEEIFPHPIDQEPVQVSSAWCREPGKLTFDWVYDHLLPNGQVQRTQMSISHHLVRWSTYLKSARNAGFRDVIAFGDFDFSPYNPDSPYLIMVAQK